MKFKVNSKFANKRLDKFLNDKFEKYSRSKIQKMIKTGNVYVNGKIVKTGYILNKSDVISVKEVDDEIKYQLSEGNFDIPLVYESKDFFVIEKPSGISVHPGETNYKEPTIVNKVLEKIDKNVGEKFRPGIVHRLDKNTSGLLIIAKTEKGYEYFVEQFKNHKIKKKYLALVKGSLKYKKGIIDSPVGRSIKNRKKMTVVDESFGKKAISSYKVFNEFKIDKDLIVSLVEVEIQTGRTHQIRVHMSAIGHSIVGDDKYGVGSFNNKFTKKFDLKRQFLHAYKLKFNDPESGKVIELESELPQELADVLKKLFLSG
ncbi:RluA family pseudouridine synthase [Candidatus Peregrinibacteria bacterium]|nr:RluA family pseudouridine synthase [Candidatus Peregrinibacteria bacterium]